MDGSGFAVAPLLVVVVAWLALNALAGAMVATAVAAVLVAACAVALVAGAPERIAQAARHRQRARQDDEGGRPA